MDLLIKKELKKERESKNLSRERLAAMCGLTSQTIYRAETTGKITFDNYLRILNALKDYGNSINDSNSNSTINSSL